MHRFFFIPLACLAISCGGSVQQSVIDTPENALPGHDQIQSEYAPEPVPEFTYKQHTVAQNGATNPVFFHSNLCPKKSETLYPWLTDEVLSEQVFSQMHNREDLLIVSYKDCTVRLLTNCKLPAKYQFTEANRTEITEFILHRNDLLKKLPFNARKLAPHFNGTGTLSIKATRVGYYTTHISSVGLDQLAGHCREGTHFVKQTDMGAFRLQIKTHTGNETKVQILETGGVLERCLLSTTDATSSACQSVLKMQLVPILAAGPMPDSAPHHLLKQLPGSERGRRLETDHMGQTIPLPSPGKVTVIAFLHPAKNTCREALTTLEKIWQRTDKGKAQIVAVVTDTTIPKARQQLSTLAVTFPLVIDDRARLTKRYLVGSKMPSVVILDQKGYMQFYSDGTSEYLQKAEAALRALTEK
jgi:peroxiredoxin